MKAASADVSIKSLRAAQVRSRSVSAASSADCLKASYSSAHTDSRNVFEMKELYESVMVHTVKAAVVTRKGLYGIRAAEQMASRVRGAWRCVPDALPHFEYSANAMLLVEGYRPFDADCAGQAKIVMREMAQDAQGCDGGRVVEVPAK